MSASWASAPQIEDAGETAPLERTLFRTLMASDVLVMVLELRDGAPEILCVNQTLCRAVGYAAQDLIGQRLTLLGTEEGDPAAHAALLAAISAGRQHRTELRCRGSDGRAVVLGVNMIPDAEPGRFVALGRDITELLRQRERDQRIQGLLTTVFTVVDTPVYLVDTEGHILMTNPALDRLVGAEPGTLSGTRSLERYHPSCHSTIMALRREEGPPANPVPLTMIRLDGAPIECDVVTAMIRRPHLDHVRIVTVRPRAAAVEPPPPAAGRVAVGGRIQLIGLDEVRETLGTRWQEVRERALATAEHVLRRHLGVHDTMVRTAEQDFIVCFADATEDEASMRAAAIGRAIRARLIGEGMGREAARVFSAVTALPPEAAGRPVAELGPMIRQGIDAKLASLQTRARERLKQALGAATYETRMIHAPRRHDAAGTLVRLPRALEGAIDAALSLLPDAETADLDADELLLSFAHECAAEAALQASRPLVFVTVDSAILLNRKRLEAYVAACGKISARLRQALVLLVTIPSGATSRLLGDGLVRLRPFFRALGMAVEGQDMRDFTAPTVGVRFVMTDLAPGADKPSVRPLADRLHALRCSLLLRDVAPTDVARVFAQGADLVLLAEAPQDGRAH